ncbi:aldehyde dehydrogenase [Nocardia callitridis]|uniref:aldehyde dehydrogenase n=1 Tax=Nocardia callitridis TaxID=648753 RepID=UPI0031EF5C0E
MGGAWSRSTGETSLEVISPHTEQAIARVAAATEPDIDAAVLAAREAITVGPWARTSPAERITAVRSLATSYESRQPDIARAITESIGAPAAFARRAQVGLPLMMMRAFCDVAQHVPWREERIGLYGKTIHLRREPVGVVAAVVAWNMPQFLIITKLVPALLAGCSVVVKPAQEAPLDALLLAEAIADSDLPPGVVSVLNGDASVGRHLVAHPGVDKVSFTGSTAAGKAVAAACAPNLTRVGLELGGKSAAIVLADADPENVASGIRTASLSNSGQICNALTRILVPAARQHEYIDALAAEMAGLTIGDPALDETQVGPLVTRRQQRRVREYIDSAHAEGARAVLGGSDMPPGIDRGWYVRPTLFAEVHNSMRIAREEIFGPVLSVIAYRDTDEAIDIANDSDYGLAGSVWTGDIDQGLAVADRVRTGTFGVNEGYTMDPLAPFGGVKASGYGRELGREGIEGYLDTKSVSVDTPPIRQPIPHNRTHHHQ